jgi:hypothetical protein
MKQFGVTSAVQGNREGELMSQHDDDAIAGAAVVYAYNDCRGSVSTNLHRMAIGASRATKSQCLVGIGRGGRGRDAGGDQSRRYRQHHFMKITHWLPLTVGALCAALIGKGSY